MNDIYLFLNTRVEESGALAWIGDKGLAPFRYLFDGKTIFIQQPRGSGQKIEIHHVASFHKRGDSNRSATYQRLTSSSTGMIKTALSILFLIPGFILGAVFKGLAYFSSDVREKHGLAKERFTPVNREIGSVSEPITTRFELQKALDQEYRKHYPQIQPTNALIIHGDGNLTINKDPGILRFNPMKLILEGAQIVHEPSPVDRLNDAMRRTRKWQVSPIRVATSSNPNNSSAITHNVNSVDEALQATAPRRSWSSCKRYHQIFTLARPQVVV